MMMKKKLSILFALLFMAMFSYQLEAQTFGAPETMKGKIVVGGNGDIGIAGNCFYLGVAPQVGFRLTRSLEVGTRVGYALDYFWEFYGNYYYHHFSGSLYASYEIISGIYVQVEDEEMCCLVRGTDLGNTTPNWYNSVFVGGGYRQYYNASSYVYYSLMYNLSWDNLSPYANPFVIRVGFCKGL